MKNLILICLLLIFACSTPQRPEIDPIENLHNQSGWEKLDGRGKSAMVLAGLGLLRCYEGSEVKEESKTTVRLGKTDFKRTTVELCRHCIKDGKPYKTGLCHKYSYLTFEPDTTWDWIIDAAKMGGGALAGFAAGGGFKQGAFFIFRKLLGIPF